jgi:ABC-type Zn uptake system ZnuABC Zn-binding protein ZnuA
MLRVVAATTQIADLALNIGGDLARVDALLSANVDPRDFELGPGDLQRLAWADVILENGVGLEDAWIKPLRHGNRSGIPVVTTPRGVRYLPGDAGNYGPSWRGVTIPEADTSRGVQVLPAGPHSPRGDPHIWFAVPNAIQMASNIRDALVEAAPSYGGYFQANAARYVEKLRALDADIVRQMAALPHSHRAFVTSSDAFRYFASRYGLALVVVEIPPASAEGQVSAQRLAALVAQIRALHVKAIFLDPSVGTPLGEQVGRDAGVRVVTTLYTSALGLPGSDGDTYIKMMRSDTAMIISTLR